MNAPLEALSVCHERTLRQCASLRRLVLNLGECGCDPQSQQAGRELLEFFDVAVLRHHADEEEDLFPALIESMAGSDAVCLHDLTGAMTLQHRELERLWSALRPALQGISSGRDHALQAQAVEDFVTQYRSHIELEETELLPMAQRLLSEDQLAILGAAMEARRAARG